MCLKASPSKPPVTSVYSPTGWQVFAGGCWLLLGEIGGCRIRNLLEIDLVATDCHGHPQFEWMTTAFLLTLTIYSLSCSEVCSAEQTGNRECSPQSKSSCLLLEPCSCNQQIWKKCNFVSGLRHTSHRRTTARKVVCRCLQTSWQLLCKLLVINQTARNQSNAMQVFNTDICCWQFSCNCSSTSCKMQAFL